MTAMKIDLARHSGFCMGVRDAVMRIVTELNDTDEEIFVYGPLIHNPQTVNILERRGLKTIKTLDDIDDRVIAIRTHGIPLEKLRDIKARSRRYINLTCPRVSKVQGLIKKYSGRGHYTIIVGDADHAEVMGLKSYASAGVTVVSSVEDIEKIPRARRYIVVSQTTQDKEHFSRMVDSLKTRFSELLVFNTICDSTHHRQDDIRLGISRNIDALVVVGGKQSANTARLARMGRECGVKTIHIESEDELSIDDFAGIENVLVTAGASTPGWIINNVMEKLYSIKNTRMGRLTTCWLGLVEYALRLNVLSAVAAFFINLFVQRYAGAVLDLKSAAVSAAYIFAMYTINNNLEMKSLLNRNPLKYSLQYTFRKLLVPLSVILLLLSLWLMLDYKTVIFALHCVAVLLGCVYSTEAVKKSILALNLSPLTRLYYLKNLVSSMGWVLATTVIPLMVHGAEWYAYVSLGFMVFTMIFIRDLFMDVIALQGDLLFGRQTLPTMMGPRKTRTLAVIMAALALAAYASITIWRGEYIFLAFVLNVLFFGLVYYDINSRHYTIALRHEMLLDLNFLIFIGMFFAVSAAG